MPGLNVSLDGRHNGAWLRRVNASAARIVLKPNQHLIFDDYLAHGIFTLGVYANESWDGHFDSHEKALDYYGREYEHCIDALQVGNESDHESESSWTMSQSQLSELGWLAREKMPDMPLVCAGMASGDPTWMYSVDLRAFNATAFHPYAKDATPANDLEDMFALAQAMRDLGLPTWITEWGWWGDEARGYATLRDICRWVKQGGIVERFFYFCADDRMVPPFGLFDPHGSAKPIANAFFEAGVEDPPRVLPPLPGWGWPDVGWIGDGLKDELIHNGWTPTSGEHTAPIAHATTKDGVPSLVAWDPHTGRSSAYVRVR